MTTTTQAKAAPAGSWVIPIQGYASDLEHLTSNFTTPPRFVTKDEKQGVLYTSDSFDGCTDARDVLAKAALEIASLAGVFRFIRDSPEPLRCTGSVLRRNDKGGFNHWVFPQPAIMRMTVGDVNSELGDSQGNAIPTPPPRTVQLANLVSKDKAVEKCLRLFSYEDAMSWVGLYRIYEVIEADVGGMKQLEKLSWSSPADLDRFKHSANSVQVAGDKARHGKENTQPPKNPMTLDQAAAYLRYLLESWISAKGV